MSELVPAGFESSATPQQRINSLVESGIGESTIASAVGVGVGTVKRWQNGTTTNLRDTSFEALDNIRLAMEIIITNEVEPEYAAVWMQSPISDNPDNIPIKVIRHEPEEVLDGIKRLFGVEEKAEDATIDQQPEDEEEITPVTETGTKIESKIVTETRTYEVTGTQPVDEWTVVEEELGRRGLSLRLTKKVTDSGETLLEGPFLNKDYFYEVAESHEKFRRHLAGRAWNALTATYAAKFVDSGWPRIPDSFLDSPLQFSIAPPLNADNSRSINGYASQIDGLDLHSLKLFLSLIDEKIQAAEGNFDKVDLPENMGEVTVEFLRAVVDFAENTSEIEE